MNILVNGLRQSLGLTELKIIGIIRLGNTAKMTNVRNVLFKNVMQGDSPMIRCNMIFRDWLFFWRTLFRRHWIFQVGYWMIFVVSMAFSLKFRWMIPFTLILYGVLWPCMMVNDEQIRRTRESQMYYRGSKTGEN